MSTNATIMLVITWTAIIGMVVFFFSNVIRKERDKKEIQNE